jgi:hypothetical protein
LSIPLLADAQTPPILVIEGSTAYRCDAVMEV